MSYFRIRACRKGHYSIDYRRVREGDVCSECGEPVIDQCPACGRVIKEWIYYGASLRGPKKESVELPDTCPHCGSPLPWKR